MRWSEEASLLSEEMARILKYFEWHANWWTTRANQVMSKDKEGLEGFRAYAHRQARIKKHLRSLFHGLWVEFGSLACEMETNVLSSTLTTTGM
jgi:hypothetical protein